MCWPSTAIWRRIAGPAFKLAAALDPKRPGDYCSMDIYNGVCDWIERNIGSASIRQAGIEIGKRIFDNIVATHKMTAVTPLTMMEALKWAASTMIRDPKGRGWEILGHDGHSVVMRRTQSFNCILQEGLLRALVERTGVEGVDVDHLKCTRRGDDFCDFKVTWVRGIKSAGAPT